MNDYYVYEWIRLDTNEPFYVGKGKGYLMEGKNNSNAKAVICLATSKVFFTAKEGAEYYNIQSKSHLGQCCQGKRKSCGKLPDGTKLVWIYLDDFLSKCEYIEL